MKKPLLLLSLIALIVFGIFFLKSNKSTIDTSNEFRFRLHSEPPTLDWSLATDNVSADILFNLMEGLVQFDKDLNVLPALATKWDISSNGLRYTFHLRKDAKWSDGQPVTAQDFVYGWNRILDPNTASAYAYFLFDIKNAQNFNKGNLKDFSKVGVQAKDNHTLVVDLWHRASYFIKIHTFWGTFPLREDIVKKYGTGWAEPNKIVTCGPFILSEWKHDYKVVLAQNPHYYGKLPDIKKATAYIINEDATALSLYETNKIDLLRRIHPLVISKYKNLPDYQSAPFLRGYYYGINTTKKPMDDVRVRRALALAVDRSQFPEILQGNQVPISSWVPKGMFGYEESIGLKFNPKRAQKLLSDAGYPNGKGFPPVKMVYDSRDDNKVVAESLQQQWKKNLNINLEIDNQEWKIHLKQLETNPPHLWRLGWGADFPDPDNFLNLFTSYSGNNHTRWKNKRYDELIALGAKELKDTKRLSYYREAQQILTEKDTPIIPLFLESQNILLKSHVKGYHLNPMGNTILKHVSVNK